MIDLSEFYTEYHSCHNPEGFVPLPKIELGIFKRYMCKPLCYRATGNNRATLKVSEITLSPHFDAGFEPQQVSLTTCNVICFKKKTVQQQQNARAMKLYQRRYN